MIFRPATPGFIVTLVATILLALVSFNTPIIKSIYFLKASLTVSNVQGTIKLGTLGYCLELSTNGTTCSDPKVGYKFDPNALLGNDTNIEIPSVVVKWITYALFLHVIALCAAGVSALFGLLAHVREMSMTCCSTLISGLAAFLTLIAFIFDIVLFFIVKKRVEDIDGSASFGGAVWMTLAAWILLLFSGCVYACGRCCVRRRPRNQDGRMDDSWMSKFTGGAPADPHAEQMRLDAVKAEQERKARQKNEVGLPAFPDRSEVLEPLKHAEESEDEHGPGPYRDHYNSTPGMAGAGAGGPRRQGSASTAGQTYRGGYAQAAPGTRAVDDYYSPTSPAQSNSGAAHMGYPPNRQYSTSPGVYHSTSPGPAAVGAAALGGAAAGAGAAYLAAGAGGAGYGHTSTGTSYHTAGSSQHDQYASAYSQYDPYSQTPSHVRQSSYDQPGSGYAGAYAVTTGGATAQQQPSSSYANYGTGTGYGDPYASPQPNTNAYTAGGTAYQSPTTQQQNLQPERSYTLGGGGYGANVVPDVGTGTTAYGVPAVSTSPPPMPAATVSAVGSGSGAVNSGSKAGPSHGRGSGSSSYEDAPPGYDANPSVHVPAWGSKV